MPVAAPPEDSGRLIGWLRTSPTADGIIDLGPGAGRDGGRVVFEGTPADLVAARSTLTGEHLAAYVG
ncbi:MAG: uvrA [Solirubrobacterales bacterium]|jgi:excinuclease UvrABC ATPase subunit|nr:uvrA [Solirubrobacterales bacterium]